MKRLRIWLAEPHGKLKTYMTDAEAADFWQCLEAAKWTEEKSDG